MQCWASINHLGFDEDLRAMPPEALDNAIRTTMTFIQREYWTLARWRQRFRV